MDREEPFASNTDRSFFDSLGESGDVTGPNATASAPAPAPAAAPVAAPAAAPVAAPVVSSTAAPVASATAMPTSMASAATAASAAIADLSSKVMESPGLMVASIFVLLLIIFVVIYLYVKLKRNLKFYEIIAKPVYLKNLKSMTLASDSSFPKGRGSQFTYAFWLYYNKIEATSNYKLLMRREDNPIIYMNPSEGKMHIRLRTVLAATQDAKITTINTNIVPGTSASSTKVEWKDTNGIMGGTPSTYPTANTYFDNDHCHYSSIIINYVPMSRWVHYAVVVDGEYIIVYQDGEINSVLNLASSDKCKKDGGKKELTAAAGTGTYFSGNNDNQNVGGITTTTGDLKIGNETTTDSPDAVISRMLFFNYATTMQNVMDLYNKGPMPQSVLSQLGIPMYGMRSPFYRIDSVDVADANATTA